MYPILVQFYVDQFETGHALLSWSVDLHVIFALSLIYFLSLFLTFDLSHFWRLNCKLALQWVLDDIKHQYEN